MAKLKSGTRIYGNAGIDTSLTVGTAVTISGGIVTATSFRGDASYFRNNSIDSTLFNIGFTSSLTATLTGIGTTVLTLPSTTGREYIIHSINVANVSTASTEINVIGAFDFVATERSYFAYNIPVPTGTSLEMLKQPQILNPSDRITMRSTDFNRVGIDSSLEVYISYQERNTVTDYFGVGLGTVGLAVSDRVPVYTSVSSPSMIQSIRLANRTDSGAYPVSVFVTTSGLSTINLVNNLIIPKYSSIELLDAPKRIGTNDTIGIQLNQASTIDIQVSGRLISS